MPTTADLTPAAKSSASPQMSAKATIHSGGGEALVPDLRGNVSRRMSRVKVVCVLLLCALAAPVPAGAQEGNGPYAPFPSAPEGGAGDAWYAELNADVPSAQLGDGVFTKRLQRVDEGGASDRAGVGIGNPAPAALLLLAGIGLAGGVALARPHLRDTTGEGQTA
ncbi:MAG: hypothetical protein JHC95_02350 [Solirubrobacteraceae bacterium]|nr:hypothetical protein [Solirubrobacteraceae bacterium]